MAGISAIVASLLRRVRRTAHNKDDEFARQQGWQVEAGRFGHRIYRDPRFDRLARCPDCTGSGWCGETDCRRCSGTGRVTLSGPAAA